jgi:ABC-type branched-subunit amino acid transport system ATPase component
LSTLRPPNQPARLSAPVQRSFKLLRVTDAGDISDSQGALIMLYGHSGAGKTTTAAKIALSPEWAPGIIFDAEAGAKSVAHMTGIIKVHTVRTWLEIVELVDTIWLARTPEDLVYKLFIFDNLSWIENLCLEHHKATDSRGPQKYAELQHYGKVKVDIVGIVNKLRDAAETKRIIIVLNAWEKPDMRLILSRL